MENVSGQTWSTSRNCGWIHFVGGPYDGKHGFYDHNQYDQIGFSHANERVSHSYKPARHISPWHYEYMGPHYWDQDFRNWFWWCADQPAVTA